MVNIVTIEGNQFLVDVGHGSAGPHHPVPLKPGYSAINIGEQTIRLTQENIPDLLTSKSASSSAPQQLWLYSYRHQDDGPWIPAYCFSETEFTPSDFTMMSSFMSTSRTSMFVTSVLCVKLIMENGELVGDLTLFGGELKKRIQGKSELLAECTTEQQRIDALDKWMGIQLTEEERNGIRGMLSELI
jgi:arylamine N-acetyltransferase